MYPQFEITVTHIDGIAGTFPVTPWVIDQYEQMAQKSFLKTFSSMENLDAGSHYLLAFLAERNAGGEVSAWREAYIKTLATLPVLKYLDENPKENPSPNSDDSSPE